MLSQLQHRIAAIVCGLPEAEGFALAGGAGLIVHRLVDRETHDLDYFATHAEEVGRLAPALERALRAEGLAVQRMQSGQGFVRLEVTDGHDLCEVDLAYDARLLPTTETTIGPVLAEDELAADKMLALYGRARGRDFADVHALLDRYPPERLMELAAAKDRGFSVPRFAEALAAIDRLPREDFPVADATLTRLRERIEGWWGELTWQQSEPRREIDPPGLSR